MNERKPWYKSVTLWGLVLALLGHLLRGGDFFGADTQALVSEILTYVGLAGAGYGRVRATATIRSQPPRGPAVLLVLLALLLAGGCTTTYTGATSRTTVEAYGQSGTTAELGVDGDTVCKVTGAKSSLRVDVGTARRICEAHRGNGCRWEPARAPAPATSAPRSAARSREAGSPCWARAGR